MAEHYEVELMRKDGSLFWADIHATPYRNTTGEVVGTRPGYGGTVKATELRKASAPAPGAPVAAASRRDLPKGSAADDTDEVSSGSSSPRSSSLSEDALSSEV